MPDLVDRVLAIDPGEKRLGLAVSDPFGNFPVALDTLPCKGDFLSALKGICDQYQVARIVMGLPLHMSGQESVSSERARALAEEITAFLQVEVVLFDERLTSKIAESILKEQGVKASSRRRKGQVDQVAAMQILQNYLDANHHQLRRSSVDVSD